MEPEETIDYNIRKTWYNITKLYNRTANEYMASMALGMIILNIDIMEGTPSTQLGPNMGMEATTLSRSLNKLEESFNKNPYNPKTDFQGDYNNKHFKETRPDISRHAKLRGGALGRGDGAPRGDRERIPGERPK